MNNVLMNCKLVIVAQFLRWIGNDLYSTQVAECIQKHVGKMYMVERPEQIQMRSILSLFGLSIDGATCREYKSSIDAPFPFCELQKTVN